MADGPEVEVYVDDFVVSRPARIPARFIELHLDADGRGSLRVDGQPDAEELVRPPMGSSPPLCSLEGTVVHPLGDSRFRVVHDFDSLASVRSFIADVSNKNAFAWEKDHRILILRPAEGPSSGTKFANFLYPRPVRLPATLRMVVTDMEPEPFAIELRFLQKDFGKLGVYFFTDKERPFGIRASWFSAKENRISSLFDIDLPANGHVENDFKAPLNEGDRQCSIFFQRRNGEMSIRWIDVEAAFPARLGLRLADQGGKVVVKRVLEGPAARAGVKAGDVLLQIDGKPIRDFQAAVAIVRDRSVGDTLRLAIERNGVKSSVPVIAE